MKVTRVIDRSLNGFTAKKNENHSDVGDGTIEFAVRQSNQSSAVFIDNFLGTILIAVMEMSMLFDVSRR